VTSEPRTTASSYRSAGWAAIASGVIGLAAYGCLLSAVLTRDSWFLSRYVYLMFKANQVGFILQLLLLIPAAAGLQKLSQQQSPGISRAALNAGIGALALAVVSLLLGIVSILPEGYSFTTLGMVGVWLIIVNWRLSRVMPRWLRWLGMTVGLGVLIFGSYAPIYAMFVDSVIFRIPAVDLATYPEPPMNFANTILHHYVIWIGSIMGLLPLPIWTLLVGRRLLREGALEHKSRQNSR
jgi:hypothetical protein